MPDDVILINITFKGDKSVPVGTKGSSFHAIFLEEGGFPVEWIKGGGGGGGG